MEKHNKIAIRQGAIYVPAQEITSVQNWVSTFVNLAKLKELGYTLDSKALSIWKTTTEEFQDLYVDFVRTVTGSKLNWTPLIKQWDVPPKDSEFAHVLTWFNQLVGGSGTTLVCGHTIPANVFELEKYNGCPFCGTPFEADMEIPVGQGSKLKILKLWGDRELLNYFDNLLKSKTPLDGTQKEAVLTLLEIYPVPEVEVGMIETKMFLVDQLVALGKRKEASKLFKLPSDVLRYLWYKHTGNLQIVKPKTILNKTARDSRRGYSRYRSSVNTSEVANKKEQLKLKYSRPEARKIAEWMNEFDGIRPVLDSMNPHREMWVRFIRAARLNEFAKQAGFERLKDLLYIFQNQGTGLGWAHLVNKAMKEHSLTLGLHLLKQRPGVFSRMLFSLLLKYDAALVMDAFKEVLTKLPMRLIVTLTQAAKVYFSGQTRVVKPLGAGLTKTIDPHPLVAVMSATERKQYMELVESLVDEAIFQRFAATPNENKTMYIHPDLEYIPFSIGDRSETVQDLAHFLQGQRFPLQSKQVRLFMNWGEGLPAQHLDMDLYADVVYPNHTDICYFGHLNITGATHSGDIQHIPNKIGTAEFINLDVEKLQANGASGVIFHCRAYNKSALEMNLRVGWMASTNPMKVTASGVAFDPSCVEQMISVKSELGQGLIFGYLDLQAEQIVWLEMPQTGNAGKSGMDNVKAMLNKLSAKFSIQKLLVIKALAQGLTIISEPAEANEVYDLDWAKDVAGVTQLLAD